MTATTAAAAPGERPPLTLSAKALYASGAAANAIKQRGLATFLLIFYNQVVGLDPQTVSFAIMIALIFDAVVDPTVGQISDNFRSPWGRRHPFMYAAALPVAVGFFLIWNPPGWSEGAIFAYMLVCLLAIRLFDTFFELPSSALLAELVKGYDERTNLISMRSLAGVIGGLLMTLAVYQVFMPENPDGTGGITEREGYFAYSLTAAVVIFFIIIASSWGTHRYIPYLQAPPTRKITVAGMIKEVGHTLNNRGWVVLTIAGMFTSISLGIKHALELYWWLYFWELKQSQLSLLTIAGVIASFLGVAIAPRVSAALGKRTGAMVMFIGAVIALIAPISLRLVGLMPPNGTDLLFWILFVDVIANSSMALATGVMLASMIADVVEDAEVKTGRRSEGLLMSADNLFKKIVSGVGVFISGVLLAVVSFPDDAKRGAVDPELMRNLALLYIPTIVFFYGIAISCLLLYRIDRTTHEANLAELEARALKSRTTDAELEAGALDGAGASGDFTPPRPK